MQSIIIISAILACGAAAPAYLLAEQAHVIHTAPLKSTYTHSSQVVDHGSTHVLHPVTTVHSNANQVVNHGSFLHAVNVLPVHETYHIPKTTITKSNQVVSHGGTTVFHAPVVSAVHTPVVYHSSPLVTYKTGDSAVTHHSSTVHETVPVVNSLPLIGVHH